MKKIISFLLFTLFFMADSSAQSPPLTEGTDITLRNTLQDPGEAETTYSGLFGLADDAFDEFATLSNTDVEFATALAQAETPFGDISGLYEIDLTENSIEFTALPDENDPFWTNVFGTFPAGKFDRYYFTFSEPHNITSATSDNASVNLRIDSETVIVVEISEGYDLMPGISFSISLNEVQTEAIPTVSEWGLIILALILLNLGVLYIRQTELRIKEA